MTNERKPQQSSGEITADDIQKLSTQITRLGKKPRTTISPSSSVNTSPKPKTAEPEEDKRHTKQILKKGKLRTPKLHPHRLYRRPSTIKASTYSPQANHITLPIKERAAIQNFCEHYYYSAETLKPLFEYDEFKGMFKGLLKSGSLFAS